MAILTPLADEFAREGFAAKAVAVLKKIQKIDPQPARRGRPAGLAHPGEAEAGHGGRAGGGVDARLRDGGDRLRGPAVRRRTGGRGFVPQFEAEPEAELHRRASVRPGPIAGAARAGAVGRGARPRTRPRSRPGSAAPRPGPRRDARAGRGLRPHRRDLRGRAAPRRRRRHRRADPGAGAAAEPEAELRWSRRRRRARHRARAGARGARGADDGERLRATSSWTSSRARSARARRARRRARGARRAGGNQIVVSPLFKDFSVDEMVAVIQGLNLITFEAGRHHPHRGRSRRQPLHAHRRAR